LNDHASEPLLTAGVVADTHIPDRVAELHPLLIPKLREAGVRHIFHAGDICAQSVLDQLSQVAPVTAVRGNRDVVIGRLQLVEEMELRGVRVAVTHGHGGFRRYLWDKWQFMLFGYVLKRYIKMLVRAGRASKVVIFGHTHQPETVWKSGKLLFNPGSASFGAQHDLPPTFGLLHIYKNQKITAEIIRLEGYTIKNRRWAGN
jgi:putative phosphoesterase